MFKMTQVIAAAASLALLAGAAHAAPMTVKASDLDLSTAAGQKELDKRAESAAKTLCRGTYMAEVNCVPGAKAKIVEKATAQGSVTIGKNGAKVVFLAQN
jgi:UrcA family protein